MRIINWNLQSRRDVHLLRPFGSSDFLQLYFHVWWEICNFWGLLWNLSHFLSQDANTKLCSGDAAEVTGSQGPLENKKKVRAQYLCILFPKKKSKAPDAPSPVQAFTQNKYLLNYCNPNEKACEESVRWVWKASNTQYMQLTCCLDCVICFRGCGVWTSLEMFLQVKGRRTISNTENGPDNSVSVTYIKYVLFCFFGLIILSYLPSIRFQDRKH